MGTSHSGVAVLMAAFLAMASAQAAAAHEAEPSPWPVHELPLGDHYVDASLQPYSPDGRFPSANRQAIHVAHVTPGQAYRLGLRLRSSVAKKLSVSLYDRWPYAEGARPIPLATGGALRGRQGELEYQWWFSIDRESAGSLLYIKVAVEPGFVGSDADWDYRIFIVDSPRSPMNSLGRGVTYHRGPSGLKLLENSPSVPLHYVDMPQVRPVRHVNGGWRPGQPSHSSGLIKNGDFEDGLKYWQLQPQDAVGVGVLDGKLRLWSRDSVDSAGIMQQMNVDVAGMGSLQLEMDLMISAQTEPAREGRAPLIFSLCYEDVRGRFHCGDTAFRKHFAIHLGDARERKRNMVFLPAKTWSRYKFDLKLLSPRRLISIGLAGAGVPERKAWVRRISIKPYPIRTGR